jgi:two-component system chemotaxis response regulator CheB
MIKVLVVNDSATSRAAIRLALAGEEDVTIVGELDSARRAVELARATQPDVVLMDIMMPEVDGFEAARQLRRTSRVPIVLITASASPSDVAVAMEALRAGAIAVLESPPAPTDPRYELVRRSLVVTVRSAAALPRHKNDATSPPATDPPTTAPATTTASAEGRSFEVVGIVTSLGGPPVLADLFAAVAADHPPFLLVQHIEASFVNGFAEWLQTRTKSRIEVGRSGAELARSTIYVAPADHHLAVSRDKKALVTTTAPVGGFRPSGNVLLASLATAFGRSACAVILTGMGRDGAEGAKKLHDAGGFVIAQDEASCVVAGMTNAARDAGAVDLTLPPGAIAAYLR